MKLSPNFGRYLPRTLLGTVIQSACGNGRDGGRSYQRFTQPRPRSGTHHFYSQPTAQTSDTCQNLTHACVLRRKKRGFGKP